MKLSKIVFYIVTMTMFFSCSIYKKEPRTSLTEFKNLLINGYAYKVKNKLGVVFLHRNSHMIETCIYNVPPNYYTKKYLNQFYSLLTTEFRRFKTPVFVKRLEQCSQTSDIYVQIHEGEITKRRQLTDFKKILTRKGVSSKLWNGTIYNKYALTKIYSSIDHSSATIKNTVGFVSFNQMSKYLDNPIILRTLKSFIIEELFQVVTLGKDIKVRYNSMSKLQEKHGITISGKVNAEEFKILNHYAPIALCGFDLWALKLNFSYKDDLFFFKDYIDRFDRDYVKIEKQSLAIMNNPAYKGLFDPRCSGKNTGINTKIGIE